MASDSLQDMILLMDKKYAGDGAVPCPNEGVQVKQGNMLHTEHGSLAVHGSGALLICGRCGYQTPTSR